MKTGDNSPEPSCGLAPKASEAEIKALAELEALQIRIPPIAEEAGWREANLRLLGTNATDAVLALVSHVANLVRLDLAGTAVTDAGRSPDCDGQSRSDASFIWKKLASPIRVWRIFAN